MRRFHFFMCFGFRGHKVPEDDLHETGLNQDEHYVALGPPFLEPYASIRPNGTLNEILFKKKVHHVALKTLKSRHLNEIL